VKALKQLKTAKIGYIMISIAFYISGLCCIISPNVMGRNGKVAAGILLIAYGIIKMIGYFSKDLYCLAFQYDLACGIFLIILGILILLDSLLVIQTSLDARRFGMTEWKWFLFFSVLSGVLGITIIICKTMLIAGVALLAEGGMRHYMVHCTVKIEP
jgi:uncharacterized membrane protein HdeD (DUF308 family)